MKQSPQPPNNLTERVATIEERTQHLATKEELSTLSTTVERRFTWVIVGAFLAMCACFLAAVASLWKESPPAPQSPPVVVVSPCQY